MKQKIWIRLMTTALAIIWMIVIFSYSSKSGVASTQESYRVGLWVGQAIVPGFGDWSQEKQLAFAEKIDYPVRKIAHASEYAILAVFFLLALQAWDIKCNLYRCAWIMATGYACTDEFHQLFVPGRSGKLMDVGIDSAGALAAVLLIWMISSIVIHYKKN